MPRLKPDELTRQTDPQLTERYGHLVVWEYKEGQVGYGWGWCANCQRHFDEEERIHVIRVLLSHSQRENNIEIGVCRDYAACERRRIARG